MNSKSFLLLSVLIPLVLCPCLTTAQDSSGASVQARLDFVSWGEDLKGVEAGSATKHVPVSTLAFRYSEPLKYDGPQVISIYWKPTAAPVVEEPTSFNGIPIPPAAPPAAAATPTDAATEEKIPEELAKRREKEPNLAAIVPLLAGASQMTILLAPGPQNTFHCFVIDDEPTRFPWGRVRLHNYATAPIGLRLDGAKMVALKYRESIVAPATADGSTIYQLAYQKDGKWKPQENNIIHVNPDEQVHFIVLQSDASFFRSSDGSRGGKLQTVTLRRQKPAAAPPK